MSDIMSWGDWSLNEGVGAGLASVGSGLSSLIYGGKTLKQNQQAIDNAYQINQQNYQAMKEQQKYERQLQQTMFNREDSSIQRRAKDMRMAGLSKTLAAGSGAQAGPVIKSTPPSMGTSHIDKQFQQTQMKIALMTQAADIARTQAQTKLIETQAQKEQSSITNVNLSNVGKQIENTLSRRSLESKARTYEANAQYSEAKAKKMVSEAEYQKIKTEIQRRLKGSNILKAKMDTITAGVIAELNVIRKRNAMWNTSLYEMLFLPTDTNMGQNMQMINMLRQAVGSDTGSTRSKTDEIGEYTARSIEKRFPRW